jgi:hypothetical protein
MIIIYNNHLLGQKTTTEISTYILQMINDLGGKTFKRDDSYDDDEQHESKTDAALIHPQM